MVPWDGDMQKPFHKNPFFPLYYTPVFAPVQQKRLRKDAVRYLRKRVMFSIITAEKL